MRALEISDLRAAIRCERKIGLDYEDARAERTTRVVWPLVLIFYVDSAVLVGWCELRQGLRHFRLDRVRQCDFLADSFAGKGEALAARWEETLKSETVTTRDL